MKPSEVREFLVNIPSLKNGLHEFQFEINDKFFDRFERALVEKGSGACILSLKKSETMMQLRFGFAVEVELVCDRSLDKFLFPIEKEQDLMIKFGEVEEELSEDLVVISKDTQTFDVAPYILEFISLSVPMKKLHPRYEGKDSPDMIYQSEPKEETDEVDPRWEVLKKLRNK